MHTITLSPETFARLQAHAEPLVDTAESVVMRALDALEMRLPASTESQKYDMPLYDPASPPNLSFTTVKSVVVAGRRHPPSETYWNSIVHAVIREAAATGRTPAEIVALSLANTVEGEKEDGGYKFIAEARLSVQGQDANSAWRTAFHMADRWTIPIEVVFAWQDTPKAAVPGGLGRMVLG